MALLTQEPTQKLLFHTSGKTEGVLGVAGGPWVNHECATGVGLDRALLGEGEVGCASSRLSDRVFSALGFQGTTPQRRSFHSESCPLASLKSGITLVGGKEQLPKMTTRTTQGLPFTLGSRKGLLEPIPGPRICLLQAALPRVRMEVISVLPVTSFQHLPLSVCPASLSFPEDYSPSFQETGLDGLLELS